MKQTITHCVAVLVALTLFASCGNNVNQPQNNAQDTVKKDSTKFDSAKSKQASRPINTDLNNMARFIAGMEIPDGSKFDTLKKNNEWKNYSKSLNDNWAKADSTKIQKMKPWAQTELAPLQTKALFYPFAGADMLNAYTLFPRAQKYFLVGLEPVGTPPDFKKIAEAKELDHYFNAVKQSISTILNFSFFRTKAMATEFRQTDVNGTIHVILLFLERTGNSIIDIKPVAVNSRGELVTYSTFEESHKDSLKNKGAEIDFVSADSVEHSAIYFSINLVNSSFAQNEGFKTFIKNQGADITYLKSASYLMHKDYFSDIRTTILQNSRAILQDDSGMPWKYLNDGAHDITLYGTYKGPISLFSMNMQKDLDSTYKKEAANVKALPFGIGYKYRQGESNLMLAVKNKNVPTKISAATSEEIKTTHAEKEIPSRK